MVDVVNFNILWLHVIQSGTIALLSLDASYQLISMLSY